MKQRLHFISGLLRSGSTLLGARLEVLGDLYPQSRVIAMVRHMPWIVDSVERLVRKNAFSPSSIFNYSAGGTVYTRANGITGAEGLVGYPYDALKQAFYGTHAGRVGTGCGLKINLYPTSGSQKAIPFLPTGGSHDIDYTLSLYR